MRPLTNIQIDVLGIVADVGPLTASDVGDYHLPIGQSRARSVLNSLEGRGLVGRTYTAHLHGGARFAFELTWAGREALEALFPDENEEPA